MKLPVMLRGQCYLVEIPTSSLADIRRAIKTALDILDDSFHLMFCDSDWSRIKFVLNDTRQLERFVGKKGKCKLHVEFPTVKKPPQKKLKNNDGLAVAAGNPGGAA